MANELVSLKDLSKLLDVSVATVNYYTNLGLLRVADRKGNQRLYDRQESIQTNARIKKMRQEGYSLMVIQKQLNK